MFEVEDLFDITKQGAFSNKEEFLNFAKEATKEELFDLMEVGAFSSIEEFKSSFSEKKNQVVTPSNGEKVVTESITKTETTPISSDSLEVSTPVDTTDLFDESISNTEIEQTGEITETEMPIVNVSNDEFLNKKEGIDYIKNNQIKKNRLELINNSGYLEGRETENPLAKTLSNEEMLALDMPDFQRERLGNSEKRYKLKNPETGEFEVFKESEIDSETLDAIKIYDKSQQSGDLGVSNGFTVSELRKDVKVNEELVSQNDLPLNIFTDNEIDREDYLKWAQKNVRKESNSFSFVKNMPLNQEGEEYFYEKRAYEKLGGYKASILNSLKNDLENVQAKKELATTPEEISVLDEKENVLKTEFKNQLTSISGLIESFPTFKKNSQDEDLRRRTEIYLAEKEGGSAEFFEEGEQVVKGGGMAIANFALDFFAGIPGAVDEGLIKLGFDEKGVLSGMSKILTDTGEALDADLGAVKRPAFTEGKPVTYKGEEFLVTSNGQVIGVETNVRLEGVIPSEDIKAIIERSKNVKNTVINTTAGSLSQGGITTMANLFALIRGGAKVKSKLGLKSGKLSMGIASFTSSIVGNVDDVRSQLMASGMNENEAMDIAINAGSAISTLDGVFSGLAGDNAKLITGLEGIKSQIKNLAIKKGKDFTVKQLVTKGKELGKEVFKEVVVEELPVLFAEKGINYLVNESIGKDVLNSKITKAEILETVVMTIGATSGLGAKRMLTGNRRSNALRMAAKNIVDLQPTIDVLVKEGSLTELQGKMAYDEIYQMQAAELKTKNTITMAHNVEEAGDLLSQREKLVEQKQGLEGPLRIDLELRIEDIDAQILILKDKDKAEALSIINGDKTKTDGISKQSTETEVPGDAKVSTEQGTDTEMELQQDGEIDGESKPTTENNQEGVTETTDPADTIEKSDSEQVVIEPTDSNNTSFEKGSMKTVTTDGGFLEIGKAKGGSNFQILGLNVDENVRRQGKAERLLIKALEYTKGKLSGMASTEAAVALNYKVGMRSKDGENLSLKETLNLFKEKGEDGYLLMIATTKSELSSEEQVIVNKKRVDSIVDGIIKKTKSRNVGKNTNPKKILKNAMSYLQGTKFYKDATDIERESSVTALNEKLGFKTKKGPSSNKALGVKNKKVTVDEKAALKDQIRLEVKAARDSKVDQSKRRKSLSDAVDYLKKVGSISLRKADGILKRVSKVNLNNAKKVQTEIDFINKTFADAEYSNKLSNANKLIRDIKRKSKKSEATIGDAGKEFAKVDPRMVDNIDLFLSNANEVLSGLKATTKPQLEKGETAPTFNIKAMNDYSKKNIEDQKKRNYEFKKETFENITGLEGSELSLEDMRDLMDGLNGNTLTETGKQKLKDKKEKLVEQAVKNAFKNTKKGIQDGISDGTLKLDKSQKTLIDSFLNMDLSLLNIQEQMSALDAIINFETNPEATGGMTAAVSQYVGKKGIVSLVKDKVSTSKKSWLGGRSWAKSIATLPNVFDLLFKSQTKARRVMKLLGVEGIINGSAKAETESSNIIKSYAKAFGKKKMKSGIYFDEVNEIERGVLAFVRRTVDGTDAEKKAEFNNRKKLVKASYEVLLKSSKETKIKEGNIIKESYEKMLADSESFNDANSKADPSNLEGVEYMTEVWNTKYEALAETSLNVYNRNLGKDLNYTPDSYVRIKAEDTTNDIDQPVFNPDGMEKSVYDKETGVLKENERIEALPKDRVLNFGFDTQNTNNLKAAMIDVNTAASIQQLKGAMASKDFDKVFPNESSKEVAKQRLAKYVQLKRGKTFVSESDKKILKALNKVTTLGVRSVLGGLTQPIKQAVPIFNTMVNAGILNTLKASKLLIDKDVRNAISNSGLPIANRGVDSQADLQSVDLKIKNTTTSLGGKIINNLDALNKVIIDYSLVKTDVGIARASFISYYIKGMDKKGLDSDSIDWTKPLDKDVAQYAQQQVDRQQNTSDSDLQGDLFTNQSLGLQLVRKTLFPFANFLLNQKTRMYADINTLYRNPTANEGDKTAAAKSLGGLAVESVMFNSLGYGITQVLSSIAQSLSGGDEDEEAAEKKKKNQIRGRLGNVVADIISPIPITNDLVLGSLNTVLSLVQDEDEKDPFKFFSKDKKTFLEQVGVLGIGIQKGKNLYEMIDLARTGVAKNEYMGNKSTAEIDSQYKEKMNAVSVSYLMYLTGVLPLSEVGYISENILKKAKKSREPKRVYQEESTPKPKKRKGTFSPSSFGNTKRKSSFKPKSFGD